MWKKSACRKETGQTPASGNDFAPKQVKHTLHNSFCIAGKRGLFLPCPEPKFEAEMFGV
jgi:hypothetical protein